MEYQCEPCNYSTKYKQHLDRHLRTERHARATSPKTHNVKTHSCGTCDRIFKTRAGKWKHEKICSAKQEPIGHADTVHEYTIEQKTIIVYRHAIKKLIELITITLNSCDINDTISSEIVRGVNELGLAYKLVEIAQ
jgi:hypothetical protein